MTLTSRFHRTTALAAGAFVGLATVLTSAAPVSASARVPVVTMATLTSSVSCAPNGWKVTWKLTTVHTEGAQGVFSNVKSSIPVQVVPPGSGGPQPAPTPPALTTFIDGGKVTGDGEFTEGQPFPPQAVTVELKLTVTWTIGTNGYIKGNLQATATAPDCRAPQPTGSAALPPPEMPGDPDDGDTGVGTPGQGNPPALPRPSPSITTKAPASASPTASAGPSPSRTTEPAGVGGGDSGDGGVLALTGAAAGSFGGGAVLLLLAGAALFVIARRRKMKFTA